MDSENLRDSETSRPGGSQNTVCNCPSTSTTHSHQSPSPNIAVTQLETSTSADAVSDLPDGSESNNPEIDTAICPICNLPRPQFDVRSEGDVDETQLSTTDGIVSEDTPPAFLSSEVSSIEKSGSAVCSSTVTFKRPKVVITTGQQKLKRRKEETATVSGVHQLVERNSPDASSSAGDGTESEETKECAICREILEGQELERSPCGHSFHANCFKRWLVQRNICPMCRSRDTGYGKKKLEEKPQERVETACGRQLLTPRRNTLVLRVSPDFFSPVQDVPVDFLAARLHPSRNVLSNLNIQRSQLPPRQYHLITSTMECVLDRIDRLADSLSQYVSSDSSSTGRDTTVTGHSDPARSDRIQICVSSASSVVESLPEENIASPTSEQATGDLRGDIRRLSRETASTVRTFLLIMQQPLQLPSDTVDVINGELNAILEVTESLSSYFR